MSEAFQNGVKKALQELENARPDGTIDPNEDRQMAELIREVSSAVSNWKKRAYEIGGSFRGPGYWAQVQRALKG